MTLPTGSSTMRIRVALADDQDLVREGLQALLERSDMEVALKASDGAELLERIDAISAEVILSDIRLSGRGPTSQGCPAHLTAP